MLAYCQQRRKDCHRGVTEPAEVIEIQGVSHCPIGQSRIRQISFYSGGQYRSLGRSALVANILLDHVAQRLLGTRQDDPQQVEARLVGYSNRIWWNIFIGCINNPFGHGLGCTHAVNLHLLLKNVRLGGQVNRPYAGPGMIIYTGPSKASSQESADAGGSPGRKAGISGSFCAGWLACTLGITGIYCPVLW